MSIWGNVAGTWRKGTLWHNVAGTWRKGTLYGNVAGTWRKDASGGQSGGGGALAATPSLDSPYGSVSRRTPTRVYTQNVTINVTGGTAPYSYVWNGDPNWTIESPSGASTRFSTIVPAGDSATATFTCVVTDSKGAGVPVMVYAEVNNYYSGGGGANIQ